MRHLSILLAPVLLAACTFQDDDADPSGAGGSGGAGSGPTTSSTVTSGDATTTSTTTGGGTPIDLPKDDNFDEDSTADDALPTNVAAPTQLAPEEGSLVAITSDDRLVYSTPGGLLTLIYIGNMSFGAGLSYGIKVLFIAAAGGFTSPRNAASHPCWSPRTIRARTSSPRSSP